MKISRAKKEYEKIPLPEKLSQKIEEAIGQKRKKIKVLKPILVTVCSFCALFIIMVNVNVSFANIAYGIPFIRELAKVVTFKEYEEKNEDQLLHVRMPKLVDTRKYKIRERAK